MPYVETCADGMLLCTGCGVLKCLVVTVEDRRGGASLCESCVAKAWEALEAHSDGADGDEGQLGALTEVG